MRVKFKQWNCETLLHTYAENGRKALLLIDAEDGAPIAKASVNITAAPLGPNEIIVKQWSENEGMLDALLDADVIESPHSWVYINDAVGSAPICRLSDRFLQAEELQDGKPGRC